MKTKTLKWSLEKNTGVYCSVDIDSAIKHGYIIEFLDEALVYDKKGNPFKEYC